MKTILFSIPVLLIIFLQLFSRETQQKPSNRNYYADSLSIRKAFSESPVLTARESIRRMQIEKGFKIHIVATEPLLNTPVAFSFDDKGRIWVVEMENYMPDSIGTGEDLPVGFQRHPCRRVRGPQDARTGLVEPPPISFVVGTLVRADVVL